MLNGETLFFGAPKICDGCNTHVGKLRILMSAAGYYIGTYCDCGPYSRETGYFSNRNAAQKALNAINAGDVSYLRT